MERSHNAAEAIVALAHDVGVRVQLHARTLAASQNAVTLTVGDDRSVPIASLYKVHLAAAWADLVNERRIDPISRILLSSTQRTPGQTGVSALVDDVELSQRDAVRQMLALSDNACAEALLEVVGLDELGAWVDRQGLTSTTIRMGTAESLRRVIADTGGRSLDEALDRLADPRYDRGTSQYDAALTSSSTAQDLTQALQTVWAGEHYDWVRESMQQQAWRHRVGSGFPHDQVTVAGKTGTLGRLRHEMAVVHFPDSQPVAVAVLTESIRPEIHQPRVDAAIGTMARHAVNALRRSAQP